MTAPGLRAQLEGTVGTRAVSVDLDTASGTLCLVGPNGAGKTSILSFLLGVLRPTRGRIEVGGELLFDSDAGVDVPLERRRLGYLPQDYALFPHLTVRENIRFALRSAERGRRREAGALRAREDEMVTALGLDDVADRRPGTLSGGEKQRAALARAVSVSPRALLLDEPLSALDVTARAGVRAFLASTLSDLGLPTVVVTHDPGEARVLGQRIAVVEQGRITQQGTWEELVREPRTAFVRAWVTAGPTPPG